MPEQLSHAEVLGRYVGTFVDELAAAGVENVCLCPGSRSTPLAITFERHPGIKTWMHLDERSCAYFALGMTSIASPVAILCSSGTAAANFAPAVIEASHSRRPLIVLTADRPQELRDLGANQTIDQVNLYGSAARWFTEMPLPEASEQMLRYVSTVAHRGVRTACGNPPGPVHLNFPFREPLEPKAYESSVRTALGAVPLQASAKRDVLDGTGGTDRSIPPAGSLFSDFVDAQRPLIISGQGDLAGFAAAKELQGAGIPILADTLSNLRTSGRFFRPHILGGYDGFLRYSPLADRLKPDLIIRFGAPPTSKPLATFLYRHRDVQQLAVSRYTNNWPDPDLTASNVIADKDDSLWYDLAKCVAKRSPIWLATWQEAQDRTNATIRYCLDKDSFVSEVSAILDLAEAIPDGQTVFAGNSMPVRDLDTFWPASNKLTFFEANRGASGIDGVISTAMGTAARGLSRVVLVIGDLSFYHDMNGLLAAQRFGLNATIVLINNDGGGIFSFLPQHEDAENFETLWGTPHGLDFSHVTGLYGVGFQRVTTRDEYKAALKASFDADGVQIIEIKTDREENLLLHQRIWDAVAEAVKDVALP
jgi:2-succinyl-5-enolpyruvyl-6-hydroxy-3-cyclohexene-1-carboxylate synthase